MQITIEAIAINKLYIKQNPRFFFRGTKNGNYFVFFRFRVKVTI